MFLNCTFSIHTKVHFPAHMKEIIAVHQVVFAPDLMKSVMEVILALLMKMRKIAVCNYITIFAYLNLCTYNMYLHTYVL